MAHVELYLTRNLCVHRFAGTSQQLLGNPDVGVPIAALLSDETDQKHLRAAVEPLLDLQESFTTLNLVFHAPGAPDSKLAPTADRSPLSVPHANPARTGFHAGSPVHLTCFVTLQLLYETNDTNGDTNGDTIIKLTATEYSQQHRQELVHTEFEAWLVHHCVQQAVIAARPNGKIVFFNHHAQELYQWSEEEALARDVSIFVSADSMQQQQEEMERMRTTGEHQKRLFKLRRKDQSTFMGYVTDAAIMNADHELEYMVGVSADQQELYNVLQELQVLNADLNAQVEARLKQLVATEHLVLEKAQQAAESEARSEAVLQTMSMLSHELRTPLQVCIAEGSSSFDKLYTSTHQF
jgi:PAS domain S-box-containing protein